MPVEQELAGPPARSPRRSSAARLFGYDMFISFALGPLPRGTQSYASDLARRLRERDFTVFFSEDEAPPGEPLTPTLRAGLHRARLLVVVANRGTLADPRWVRTEVEEFRTRHPRRPVIPISVGGALQDAALAASAQAWLGHEERIWLDEAEQAVADGIAGDTVVERLALAPTRARANVRWRWVVRGVIVSLLALTLAASGAALYALRQRDEAIRQNVIAQAGRLAAQADLLRERGGAADASVMLAAEGLARLAAIGQRSLEVDLSLRRALALLPRHQGELDSHDKVRLSPAGDHLIAEAVGGQVAVFRLPGGELQSCRWEDIRESAAPARLRLVAAASSSGAWCVVREFDQAGRRATLEIWSARPLQRVARFAVDSKAGHVFPAISDDGELVAVTDHAQTGGTAAATVRLWSRPRQAELLRLEGEEFLGFSPDNRHFATTRGLWVRTGSDQGRPQMIVAWTRHPWQLAFSRDGAQVATRGSYRDEVDLWDVAAAKLLRSTPAPEGELLAVDNNARFLMVSSHLDAVLWDSRDETGRARVPFNLKAAAFAASEPVLLAEELSPIGLARLRLLSLPPWGAALAGTELGEAEEVAWLGVRGDTVDLLIAAASGLRLELWDYRRGTRTLAASVPQAGPWAISADGRRYAVTTPDKVVVGPIGAGPPRLYIPQAAAPTHLALSSDGAYLAAATDTGMRVWRLASGEHWNSPALPGVPQAIMISRDGVYGLAVVVSGEASRAGRVYTLVRWALAQPAETVTVDLGRHLRPPPFLCTVSDDGRYIGTGGARHEIGSGADPPDLGIDDRTACEAAASPTLRLAVDGNRVWVSDARNRQRLARLDHGSKVLAVAADAAGSHVATVSEGGAVQVFAVDTAELIAQACARGPRSLGAAEERDYLGGAAGQDPCGRLRASEAPR